MFRLIFLINFLLFVLFAHECQECHLKETKNCQDSVHYTLKNAINTTREAWGVTNSHESLSTLPKPKENIESVTDLVDDFLRRKCLKCHINTKSNDGCLKCHYPHRKKGSCQIKRPQMNKCLKCHNKNYTGGEYLGLFPKDFHKSYRAPITKDGKFPPQKHGIDYHHLSSDIHFQKGLICVDCHKFYEMQGGKKASCIDCHENLSSANHPLYHDKISCVACHSMWSNHSYELSVFRDDTADYDKWKDLSLQEDTYLTSFLTKALKSKNKIDPKMPDWIDRVQKDGIWYSGYRYRRWEDFMLANTQNDKIELIKPMYQYRVSYKDKNGTMIFDDVEDIDGRKIEAWVVYSPHTISPKAKSCEMCHNNPLISEQKRSGYDVLDLKLPNRIIGATPLTKEQKNKMQSKMYKKTRAKMIIKLD